jgi:telomerase reverse transcriptase
VPDTQLRPHVSGSSSFIPGGNTQLKAKANAALPSVGSTLIGTSQDQIQKDKFTEFSSPSGEVSGFVRAVISRVIPVDFFGDGENKKIVMRAVDRFVKLRRFESLSLHEVTQSLKVIYHPHVVCTSLKFAQLTSLDWLCLSSMRPAERMSKSDETKRRQLFAEFMYWLFDSFVIPLLRSHFYTTESGVDRNRIFYFRHDVWKKLSEPTLTRLKSTMLEELTRDNAQRLLERRKLGFVQIRLLPKENGVRPIMNLRKRGMSMVNDTCRKRGFFKLQLTCCSLMVKQGSRPVSIQS